MTRLSYHLMSYPAATSIQLGSRWPESERKGDERRAVCRLFEQNRLGSSGWQGLPD